MKDFSTIHASEIILNVSPAISLIAAIFAFKAIPASAEAILPFFLLMILLGGTLLFEENPEIYKTFRTVICAILLTVACISLHFSSNIIPVLTTCWLLPEITLGLIRH